MALEQPHIFSGGKQALLLDCVVSRQKEWKQEEVYFWHRVPPQRRAAGPVRKLGQWYLSILLCVLDAAEASREWETANQPVTLIVHFVKLKWSYLNAFTLNKT